MVVVAALLAFLASQELDRPAASEKKDAFITSMREYKACVRKNAIEFERAREPIMDTVQAAFAACRDERASHLFLILEVQEAAGEADPSIIKADEHVEQLVDKQLREDLIVQLMRARSVR